MDNVAYEAFIKNKALAQQCVNCENHAPCKIDNWPLVISDGLNCDNFVGNIHDTAPTD